MNTIAVLGLKHILQDNQIGDITMENHEEVLAKLKFIGHIEKDEKVNVRHVDRQPNTLYTKISRSLLYPDNRMNTVKFIRDVVSRSFEIIEHYILRENRVLCRGIVADLIKSEIGIKNLIYTYGGDTKFVCTLQVLMEGMASQLLSLKEKHPELFENEDEPSTRK